MKKELPDARSFKVGRVIQGPNLNRLLGIPLALPAFWPSIRANGADDSGPFELRLRRRSLTELLFAPFDCAAGSASCRESTDGSIQSSDR
jgi:hypothetical protein